jgi:hypothetical protein
MKRFPSKAALKARVPVASVTVAVVVLKVPVKFEIAREVDVGADDDV